METRAAVMSQPGSLSLETVELSAPGPSDAVIAIRWSGISSGTEKLFWTGGMPAFPGMGYPLVPGYEAVGEVVEAGPGSGRRVGEAVFVPGATCFGALRGLFGGAARTLVTAGARLVPLEQGPRPEAALLALAATARHAMAGLRVAPPELIVGHGVVGRLLARLTLAAGAPAPTVWETAPARREGAQGYAVLDPADDPRRDYRAVYDASGDADLLDALIGRVARGGEVVLAGFYPGRLSFAFAPAFMKEVRLRVAAEWTPDDMLAVRLLTESGRLSLDGLISHRRAADQAPAAYAEAFGDPACLKMILDWEATA